MVKPSALTASDHMRYFFDSGLRFSCQQCGQCCTGESGTIYVSSFEIKKIASFWDVSVTVFIQQALLPYKESYIIKERPGGACLFYQDGCTIYPVRPTQCRSFPFWTQSMRSTYAWKQAARACPGIGQGRLYSREEILDILEWSPL
ncbi:MAG: YkgJ family cysteine cluster protein [Desulfovermiculus sp.]